MHIKKWKNNNENWKLIIIIYNNLSYIYKQRNLSGNVNILGKTLTNPSLTNCYYSSDYSLCIAKDMDCLNYNYSFDEIYIPKKHCSTSKTSTSKTSTTKANERKQD